MAVGDEGNERMIVRTAQAEDEGQLLALAQGFATSFAVTPEAFQATFAGLRERPDVRLVVAVTPERPDEVLGYLMGFVHPTFYANGLVAWVSEITVRADRRRTGIGGHLMRDFEEWAKGRDARMVALATRRAADFYRALGYEESAAYFRRML